MSGFAVGNELSQAIRDVGDAVSDSQEVFETDRMRKSGRKPTGELFIRELSQDIDGSARKALEQEIFVVLQMDD
jgi:hypothetical protein